MMHHFAHNNELNHVWTYLKHVCVVIVGVFNYHSLVSRQSVRYRMLSGIENGLRGVRGLDDVVLRFFDTVRIVTLMENEFAPSTASVAIWEQTIVPIMYKIN